MEERGFLIKYASQILTPNLHCRTYLSALLLGGVGGGALRYLEVELLMV